MEPEMEQDVVHIKQEPNAVMIKEEFKSESSGSDGEETTIKTEPNTWSFVSDVRGVKTELDATVKQEQHKSESSDSDGQDVTGEKTEPAAVTKQTSQFQMCGKQFTNMYSLHRHEQVPQFPCPLCWESFHTRADLADHLATHQDLDCPFRCRSCDSAFPYLQLIQDHQLEHNPELVHMCGKCPRAFDTMEKLYEHYQVHDCGLSYFNKCSLCGKVLRNQYRLVNHVKRVHTKMYMCLVCPMHTGDSQEFVAHYRAHREVTSAPCPVCHKAFLKNLMDIHLRDHPELSSYFCFSCDPPQVLTSRTLYQRHRSAKNHNARFICIFCKASYRLRCLLRKHLSRHSMYLCKYCNRCFDRKLKMYKHFNIEHATCGREQEEQKCEQRERNITETLRAFEMVLGEAPDTRHISRNQQQELGSAREASVTLDTSETVQQTSEAGASGGE